MARCHQLHSVFQALLAGALMLCLVVLNPMKLDVSLYPEDPGSCSCMKCMAEEEDPWFNIRYDIQVPRLMSSRNSNLSAYTSKWWRGLQNRPRRVNYTALVETLFMLFPDEEPYSDSGPDRCKLCALVGNSGNLEGSHYGPLIDAHDFVIRMNTGPTKGYEKDVGSKTTHRAIYPESAVDMDNSTHLVLVPFKVLDLQWLISIFTTKHIKRTYKPVKNTIRANIDKVMILHPEFIKYVYTKWLQKQGKYPSTGFLMLVFSLHICDQVNVFGFGARKDGRWHHYFDKRYGIFHNTPEHKGSVEFDIIEELHLLNKIHLYKGN
ncbi:CMP-N-acetylneuraminate-beta-galactosamide-alpha-2,3-sialyltransferase 2-like [Astyanax mexicanus]|uniref:CMP-N-acetylneuraminate-beta-galactosamide- alpha-2,3-sialyltransferase 2-like n=1 Tax=Astyanax mexicanus TaxID=7994 RepID=UPI0020CAB88E|nr:CMP-N-acetylneuraminate-beta-galactosamide-alpha-2,3-sialyltransferase 2-like [Astyanax mexicanus]